MPPAEAPTQAPTAAPASAPTAAASTEAPAERIDCAAQLKQRFPALFAGAPKPLKLRIQADIQERAPGVFSKQALSAFFRRYTGSTGYLIALTKAKTRFNLDGQPDGELSDEHREIAVKELARRREVTASRRQQEDDERRARVSLLRDFERTTLTPANFCALKGIALEQLEPLLAQAREDAKAMPVREPRHDRAGRPHAGGPRRQGDGAPPRRDAGNGERGERGPRGPRGPRR